MGLMLASAQLFLKRNAIKSAIPNPMTANFHVFVYGTLKPGECNFDRYCGNNVISSQRAYILGELYHFPLLGYPGAIPGTRQVQGFVLTFTDVATLAKLDELEDYAPARSAAENEYTRELMLTHTPSGVVSISAWVYLMTPDRVSQWGGILVPDGWWTS
jgi:gamma-glutamylcyclotransferase (GGCT)/AIG2-like uncharacterized protein YtfP